MRSEKPRGEAFAADSLAMGMAILLAMTIVQRGIGFLRGVWFCRLLDDHVVGQWAMAFGCITMMAPLMMLGLSGAMPRYVERYRQSGHLTGFLTRVMLGSLFGIGLVLAVMVVAPNWVALIIFREPSSGGLIAAVGGSAVALVAFNFVNELVASLRQVRVVSLMQFLQSVGFTVLGIAWLIIGGGLVGLLNAFSLATVLAMMPAIWVLRRDWSRLPSAGTALDAKVLWRSLLPYAAALWVMNFLTNSFELSDRYMILHYTPGGDVAAQTAVGQYHTGRMIPVLLTSLAAMFAGILMPYLAADWESGRRVEVQSRLRTVLLGLTVVFTLTAAMALLLAPWLFAGLLDGRYSAGESIMPAAFTISIWASTVTVAQVYLWLSERGKLCGIGLVLGLLANVVLNVWWLPVWGLPGAVAATLVANAVVLIGLLFALAITGYPLDGSIFWLCLLPLSLLAGPWAAIGLTLSLCLVRREIHDLLWRLVSTRLERLRRLAVEWAGRGRVLE